MQKRLQIFKVAGKTNWPINMDDIKIFAENQKELETFIQTIIIYSQNIRIELGIEKYVMLDMKKKKKKKGKTKWKNCPIKKASEHCKYLRILEADTIKQKEKKEKKISWNETLPQKLHQKNKQLGSPPCNILWQIDMEINDYAQGLTFNKWYRLQDIQDSS